MDKVECYLSGIQLCSGFISDFSDIICKYDDFETPNQMFQTILNTIYPPCEDQLIQARLKIRGLAFRHANHVFKLSR